MYRFLPNPTNLFGRNADSHQIYFAENADFHQIYFAEMPVSTNFIEKRTFLTHDFFAHEFSRIYTNNKAFR